MEVKSEEARDGTSMFHRSFWTFENMCIPGSIILGVFVGALVPGNSDLSPDYRPISSIIGWVYFFSWTVSFYPQIYQNYSRGSSMGFAPDKMLFDVVGFSCLSVYTISLYGVPYVRKLYEDQNHGNSPEVQINDVAFAVHALLMSFVQIGQLAFYDGYKQLPSKTAVVTVSITTTIIFVYLIIVLAKGEDSGVFSFLNWLYFLSFVKIGVTMVKYVPQVVLNYKRKCCIGWSIAGSIMDLNGALLSQLQLILDCNDMDDWGGITGNFVKLALGAVSVVFDLIFIVQHFVLYHDSAYQSLPSAEQPFLLSKEESDLN
jgi:cystinosin